MNKKFFIRTYGCQMNVNDSEIISAILTEAGYQKVENIELADLILFNSCTVRQHAEDRVVGRITQEGSRKDKNNLPLIGLLGCVAQRTGKKLLQSVDKLDFVVGPDQYRKLPAIIEENVQKNCRMAFLEQDNSEIYEKVKPVRRKGVNAFVTIMRGCNNFCTYCIVPYVRGRERSRAINNILAEVKEAGQDGFRDVTLLGQNVNSYRYQDWEFADLLEQAAEVDTIERLRFVTSHPKDLSAKVIATMADNDRICNSIHLPLQSASDHILEKMNRKYTFGHYYKLIEKLRNAMPDVAITTDVLVGFPGETDSDFNDTYNALKSIRFDYSFTFKYSPRDGTKAAQYPDQVAEKIRLKRLQKLIELQKQITAEKYQEKIGDTARVYVEQVSKKDQNELSGRTEDNKIAVFPGNKKLIGTFVNIEITGATGWTLLGKQINEGKWKKSR